MEIRRETLDWLLESINPSVRYYAQKDLLGLDEKDTEVWTSKESIMDSDIVKSILAAQKPDGYWATEEDMYLPKYTATTHQLLILAEHGASRTSEIGSISRMRSSP